MVLEMRKASAPMSSTFSACLLLVLATASFGPDGGAAGSDQPIGGPILEVPDNLLKKPGEDDVKLEIRLHRPMSNETKYLEESVELFCDIVGTPVPSYQWLKDGSLVPANHDRLKTKVTLYGAELSIKQLAASDTGWYTCVGQSAAGLQRTSGHLTVIPAKRRRKGKKNKPVDEGDSGPQAAPEQTGFCQDFKPTVCSTFLTGKEVFVPTIVYQYNKESQLAQLIPRMAEIVNESCLQPLTEAICRFNFPVCSRTEGIRSKPTNLCQQDCSRVTGRTCQEDFEKLRVSLAFFQEKIRPTIDYLSLLPECDSLPTASCISLKSPAPPHPPLRHPPSIPKAPEAADGCFNGSGSSYSGGLSRTRSGRSCLSWALVPGYSRVGDHSRCRNPEPGPVHQRPWCFVSRAGAWEECELRPCRHLPSPGEPRDSAEDSTSSDRSPPDSRPKSLLISMKELLPICVSLAVLSVAAVVITVICCVYRRSASDATSGESEQVAGKAMKLATRPSDTGLDLQCRTPLLAQEFPLTQIRFGDELGQSAFGRVYKGELIGLYSETSLTPVVIKCLKAGGDGNLQAEFWAEIQRLAGLSHPSLLRLMGVCVRQLPCCIILELMPHGDLREFLTRRNPRSDHSGDYHDPLSQGQMLHVATQVCSAVEYLATRCLVHRDVAARNVLLGDNLQCRLSDLGQCRDAYAQDYYPLRPGSQLPIRWMAPEATLYGQFSSPSDVYSLGVLLWEIWAYGLQPYYGYSNSDVIDLVRQRQLLASPPDCPARIYSLMMDCWAANPSHRISAGAAHDRLRQWQSELIVELSTSSQGSGHTNSTCFSDPRPASQRVIPVPVPRMSPPESSSGSLYSGVTQGLQGHSCHNPRHGPSLCVQTATSGAV